MRNSSTDERLDDFRAEVNRRFDTVDRSMAAGFAELTQRMDEGFAEMRALNQATNMRIDAFQRAMLQVGGGLIGVLVICVVTLVLALIA